MDIARLAIVIPTRGAFSYAEKAIRSAIAATQAYIPRVFVVDDASPDWDPAWIARLERQFLGLEYVHFPHHGGLLRAWNVGLRWAKARGYEAACLANSDVIFALGWDREIAAALTAYNLVGPLTNAPGTEAEQFVGKYSHMYRRDTAEIDLDLVQHELLRTVKPTRRFKEAALNGFCLVAKTDTWWAHAYDADHVFCPKNLTTAKGHKNSDPLNTLGEYEFQRRMRARGGRPGIALGSYVLHFRSASRGDAHKRGDWIRPS